MSEVRVGRLPMGGVARLEGVDVPVMATVRAEDSQ